MQFPLYRVLRSERKQGVLLVEGTITVSQAALRLSMTYGQVLRRIMLREIRGWQEDNRAWRVDAQDVERLAAGRLEQEPARQEPVSAA